MLKNLITVAAVAVIFPAVAIGSQRPAAAAKPASAQAQHAPAPKEPPQAKTREEYNEYTEASALTGGAASEKAAQHFAEKFPGSELRVYLYSRAMHAYQSENNPGKMLAMGDKVLALDPDNAVALVLTAAVLADNLGGNDKDQIKNVTAIRDRCARAQKALASGPAPPGATQQQIMAYQGTMQSMVHSTLGILELKMGNDAAAEIHLRTATQVEYAQPDPYVWYHLALAMDHQKEYPGALAAVDQALRYIGSNSELQKLATGERERLARLAVPAQAAPPDSGAGKKPQ